ncbi:hypothetical protein V8F20_005250 [Naviculisporaceae sp. PSN 640]
MVTRRQQQQQQHPPPWPEGSVAGGGRRGKGQKNGGGSMPQSRFVEGSMNDRVSAAPPPDFLGPNELAAYERQFYTPVSPQVGAPAKTRASFQHYPPRANRDFYQRRPLSSTGPAKRSSQPELHTQPNDQDQNQPQLQTRRSGFLAPLWDGVREKLSLSKSKSSQSIGRVFSKESKDKLGSTPPSPTVARPPPLENPERPAIPVAPIDPTAYPSKEEVMESYKNLVASGFFQAHAIQGTRHPLRQGNRNSTQAPREAPPVPPHTSTSPQVSLKSFAEHLAHANAQNHRTSLPGFPSIPSSPTVRPIGGESPTRAPPPPPTNRPPPPPGPVRALHSDETDVPSPQRGTKRGKPSDPNEIDPSTVAGGARKLVKKLRRSTSRASINFATGGSVSHSMAKPRPSTSSAVAASIYLSRDTTPRPSMSSNTNVPPPFSDPAAALSNAQNPFYVTEESFARLARTPPPKRKSKLIKLASAEKESTRRRIIGTLGLGGLRRAPSLSSKPQPPPQWHPDLPEQAAQPVSKPTVRATPPSPVPVHASTRSVLLPPAVFEVHEGRKSFGDTDTGEDDVDNYDSDAMVIDSPPPVVFQAAVARAVVAPAPSAFHYPQRQRFSRPLTSSGPVGPTIHEKQSPSTFRHSNFITSSATTANIPRGYPNSSPIRKKPVPPSATTTVISPPRMINKPADSTTPTKLSVSVVTKPMSPSSGNVPSTRDSGLGHGHGYVHGQSHDYTCGGGGYNHSEDMMDGLADDGDEDMENCPPPCVPTGPQAASSSYVW